MRVGWNGPYLLHLVSCTEWISKSSKLLILTVLLAVLILSYPTPAAYVFSTSPTMEPGLQDAAFADEHPVAGPVRKRAEPAVGSIEGFLQRYGVEPSRLARVAESVVRSAQKYNLDPRLIASIMIVESRANPFAISGSDAIGIMQIHLPTWGHTAEREGINLFNIEDNVDFGARILKNYVRQFGLWEGVKRYKGWTPDDPVSEQSVEEYLAKVQRTYEIQQPNSPGSELYSN